MNHITSKEKPQKSQKLWKTTSARGKNARDSHKQQTFNKNKPEKVPFSEKKFSVFLDQIHEIDPHAQDLKESEVVEVVELQRKKFYEQSPIQTLVQSESQFDHVYQCDCRDQLKKVKFEIEKFKHFHEDVEKRTKAANMLMQLVSKTEQKGEASEKLVKKIVGQLQKVDGKNRQKQLQDENREIKKKLHEMENKMLKMMGKNLQLQTKMEYYEHKMAKLQKSVDNLQSNSYEHRQQKNQARNISHSVQSSETQKTLTKNGLTAISPKSSATKRFTRTVKQTQKSDPYTTSQPKNKLKLDKK